MPADRRQLISSPGRLITAIVLILPLLSASVAAQRLSILAPAATKSDIEYAEKLTEYIAPPVRILDASLSAAAFRAVKIGDVFNMTADEAKGAAAVMGCDYFVLVRTGEQRRSSFSKPDYYEAFAVHYVVNGRTGELVAWFLRSFEAGDPAAAREAMTASVSASAREISDKIKAATQVALQAGPRIRMDEVPPEDSPAAKDLKPPIPYRRVKPEYTSTAFLYDVRATIDIEVDIDAEGKIVATRILRWAGFGLEESVEKAVRGMNWRPAMRVGKALPMRVLLRYNFTKVDKP